MDDPYVPLHRPRAPEPERHHPDREALAATPALDKVRSTSTIELGMDMTSASVVRSHTPMGLRALPVRGRGLLLRHDRRTIAVAATVEGNAGRPLPERSGGVPPAG